MHVFIDESGPFSFPNPRRPSLSFCAALVVPTQALHSLVLEFRRLTRPWCDENGEIKGSKLNEHQFDSILHLYGVHGCAVEVVGIDLGLHTPELIEDHKSGIIANLDIIVKDDQNKFFAKEVSGLIKFFKIVKYPGFIQMVLMEALTLSVFRKYVPVFSILSPVELSNVCWRIDAKEKKSPNQKKLGKDYSFGGSKPGLLQSLPFI